MDETEEILAFIEHIKQENLLVLVEGIKDKRALEELGIKNVLTLKKALYAMVEQIAEQANEVVLLTDLDEEGKKLYHRLSNDLQKHGVKINNDLREFLFKTELRHIEGLATYILTSSTILH